MALALQNLSKIPDEKKRAVHGYIREQYNKDVPHGIIVICILFYAYDWDEWDKDNISKCISLDTERAIVSQTETRKSSTFLKQIVSSGVHTWKFKVVKCKYGGATMTIGIWNTECNDGKPPINDVFYYYRKCGVSKPSGYVFATSSGGKKDLQSGFIKKYAEKCNDGFVVDMIADFNRLSLSFIVNGKDYGKAFDIKPGKYRAAVYLYWKGESYQFLEKY